MEIEGPATSLSSRVNGKGQQRLAWAGRVFESEGEEDAVLLTGTKGGKT